MIFQQITPIHFELFNPWISSLSSSFIDSWFENPYKITAEERKQIRLCFEFLDTDHDGIIYYKDWSIASNFIEQSHSNEQVQAFYNYFTSSSILYLDFLKHSISLLANKNKEKSKKAKEVTEIKSSKNEGIKSPTATAIKARPGSARPLPVSTTSKPSPRPQTASTNSKLNTPDFIIFHEMDPLIIDYNKKLGMPKYLLPEYSYQSETLELNSPDINFSKMELNSPENKNSIKISVIEADDKLPQRRNKAENSVDDYNSSFSELTISDYSVSNVESPSNLISPGVANFSSTSASSNRPVSAARHIRTSSMN